jgi:AraC-like DNA-binding protein
MLRYPQYFNQFLLFILAIGTPYIYLATYKGITQPTIWQAQSTLNKETVQEEMEEAEEIELQHAAPQTPIPGKSGMNVQRSIELVRKITQLMEEDRLYQEAELTLQQLADKLAVPTYQVSLAINEGMKKNFYDLVNGYRVEEAKRLLADERNASYTILSVAFDAGFNSKTTFNTVFKKFTGYTPTEYRNIKKASILTT